MRNRAKETGLHGPFFLPLGRARPARVAGKSGLQGANRHFFAVSGKS